MLSRLGIYFLEWQCLWRHWHLGYKKREDEDYGLWDHFIFIGPLQFRFVTSAVKVD